MLNSGAAHGTQQPPNAETRPDSLAALNEAITAATSFESIAALQAVIATLESEKNNLRAGPDPFDAFAPPPKALPSSADMLMSQLDTAPLDNEFRHFLELMLSDPEPAARKTLKKASAPRGPVPSGLAGRAVEELSATVQPPLDNTVHWKEGEVAVDAALTKFNTDEIAGQALLHTLSSKAPTAQGSLWQGKEGDDRDGA